MGEGVPLDSGSRRFLKLAALLIAIAVAASASAFALAFVQGPVAGHGAIVPAFFLALFGTVALGFAAFMGWLASRVDAHSAGFRAVPFLCLLGMAGWAVWFFCALR